VGTLRHHASGLVPEHQRQAHAAAQLSGDDQRVVVAEPGRGDMHQRLTRSRTRSIALLVAQDGRFARRSQHHGSQRDS